MQICRAKQLKMACNYPKMGFLCHPLAYQKANAMTGEELRRMRKTKRLTQADLARAIGYSRKSVISWENGVHPIADSAAAKITAACIGPLHASKAPIALVRATVDAYATMRRPPNNFSHAYIVGMWQERGFTPCREAQEQILTMFPDVLNPENQK